MGTQSPPLHLQGMQEVAVRPTEKDCLFHCYVQLRIYSSRQASPVSGHRPKDGRLRTLCNNATFRWVKSVRCETSRRISATTSSRFEAHHSYKRAHSARSKRRRPREETLIREDFGTLREMIASYDECDTPQHTSSFPHNPLYVCFSLHERVKHGLVKIVGPLHVSTVRTCVRIAAKAVLKGS